jgi:hypothetical protein
MNHLDDPTHRQARRDVDTFDERAADYETGWLGRLHHEIAQRVADLVLLLADAP